MCALSLVGLVEQDANMLRMACRYMLSLACCKTWLTDPMEGMPGATWTGRSFYGIMYRAAFGKEFDLAFFMPAMLGVMFIFIGNYLPKVKQNRTLGIKISWALNNEENWNKTHRFGGKVR